MGFVHYIPVATTLFAAFFFVEIFQHWQKNKNSMHLMWWTIGIFFYGAGTITESIHTIAGYHPANFKAWYILGPILGGAPLAQGTIYLMLKRTKADILCILMVIVVITAAAMVILSPLQPVTDPHTRLSGSLLEWKSIRILIRFLNLYAFIFLVGGAIYSAVLYSRDSIDRSRCWGNILIATGGLLPGIGGMYSRLGHIEVLYITEFIGICCIHAGYQIIKASSVPSLYPTQSPQEDVNRT